MDLPTYIQNENQENYNQELNQTLRDNLSNNGWVVPTISPTNLAIIAPDMPTGTIWFVIDPTGAISSGFVGNVNGTIMRFSVVPYP